MKIVADINMKMPPLHKYSTEYKTCALTGLTGFSGRVCLAFRARKQLRISFWFYFSSTKLGTFHHKFLHRKNDVKQVLIQKGLKSTALTDLHPMGL